MSIEALHISAAAIYTTRRYIANIRGEPTSRIARDRAIRYRLRDTGSRLPRSAGDEGGGARRNLRRDGPFSGDNGRWLPPYLLLAQLRLEDVGRVADGAHPLEARLHARQPDLDLAALRLEALAVAQHRVQLRLALHHLRVRLIPVLAQLRH